jgi:cytochrome c oxidase subunit 2
VTPLLFASLLGGPSLDPHSPQAAAIAKLFWGTLALCGAIFLIVAGLVAFCVVRFRARGREEPAQVEGSRGLEVAWTLVPLAILCWLLLLTSRAMGVADEPVDRAPDLTVIAHQWWWEVRYASGAITANEIHIPVGKRLALHIDSQDVVHDFWVPALARKIDAIPGRPVNLWLQADEPGVYLGTCAEYCGAQHAWMRIRVIAEAPEQFEAWEEHELAPAPSPVADAAARGAQTFRAKTCVTCHAIRGIGDGRIAPDLTHLAERTTLGAGVIDNTPAELARWLKDPQQIKAGSHMPNLQLSDGQVNDLVAYLETLR